MKRFVALLAFALPGLPLLQAGAEPDYARALALAGKQDHATALRLLERIVEEDPAFSRAWTALVDMRSKAGRLAEFDGDLAKSANPGACLARLEIQRLNGAPAREMERSGRACAARAPCSFAVHRLWVSQQSKERRAELAAEFASSAGSDPALVFAAGFALAPGAAAVERFERVPRDALNADNANVLDSELYLALPPGDPKRESSAQRLLARARASSDADWIYRATARLGEVALDRTRFSDALPLLREAAAGAQALGRPSSIFHAMTGETLFRLGRVDEAAGAFQQCSASAADERNNAREATCLGWLSDQHNELGQHTAAVDFALRSLEAAKKAGSAVTIADQHINLAFAWLALGQGPRALDSLREAEAAAAPPARPWHARILADAGNLYRQSGRPKEALAAIDRSFDSASDPVRRAESHLLRAEVLASLRRDAEAVRDLDAAANLAPGIAGYQARNRLARGRVALDRARHGEALDAFRSALASSAGFPMHAVNAHSGLSDVHWRQGRFDEALAERQRAIEIVERIRSRLITGHRAGFLAGRVRLYRESAELLLRLNRVDAAFEMAERGRARALLDLSEGDRSDAAPEDLIRVRAAMAAVRSARDLAGRRKADLELQAATDRYLMAIGNARSAAAPLSAERIRARLDARSAILHYSLADPLSSLFVVTRDRIRHFALPPHAKLEAEVRGALALLREPPDVLKQDELTARLRGLHRTLLGPAWGAISGMREIVVAPDGALHLLPFEALVEGDAAGSPSYLVQRLLVRYAPSATLAAAMPASEAAPSLLAYGDPLGTGLNAFRGEAFGRLPFTRQEVMDVAALYPAAVRKIALAGDASESALKQDPALSSSSVVHLAVHGFADDRWPGMSGLVLPQRPGDSSEDGVLRTYEILGLRLKAGVVVLSACDSGSGMEITGEGLSSLRYAFLAAGARSIVASLWRVNDRAAASLMVSFHRQLARAPHRGAEALRAAQLGMLRSGAYSHPYYWSVFTMMSRAE